MLQTLWLTLDFSDALSNLLPDIAEAQTAQIFLQLMDCEAVGRLKRLTQAQPASTSPAQWVPGVIKLELDWPQRAQLAQLLAAQVPRNAPASLYLEQGGQTLRCRLEDFEAAAVVTLLEAGVQALEQLIATQQA
ncbi:MAG: hypothetical protein F6J97_04860 [Leptolyngbya sp. SIO4C1]|nr:hypothetical protein [Leptolyngbya sp. SIO4C1]